MTYSQQENVQPVILAVLDGWGVAPPGPYNAITQAKTPVMDMLQKTYPYTTLKASGKAVGLIDGIVGNSEVGHMNLGAGRIVSQDLVNVNRTIEDGTFMNNSVLLDAMKHAKQNQKKLHLLGMLSDSGVHSYLPHLFELLKMAKANGLEEVYVHGITDGRDSHPASAIGYLQLVREKIAEIGVGKIASLSGRFYAMDRIFQWDRSAKLYHALVQGSPLYSGTPEKYLQDCYDRGVTDEFISPMTFVTNHKADGPIGNGDSIIFWHLRSDRARQITKMFVQKEFSDFPRGRMLEDIKFVAFTDFGNDLNVPTAFKTYPVERSLPEIFSEINDFHHLYVAEAEKYPHISYFFHGSSSIRLPGEDIVRVESPRVRNYSATPAMSSNQVTQIVKIDLQEMFHHRHDFVLVNYSNADMLGHSGKINKAIEAVEILDAQLGEIYKLIQQKGGTLIITADHGNAEVMRDPDTREENTSHTISDVPFILVSTDPRYQKEAIRLHENGILANVAPTILQLLNIPKPDVMKGESLIEVSP